MRVVRVEHVRLGSTGLRVSQVCLGTMTFGSQCDERLSWCILDRAAGGGVTFLDTADVYPLGGGMETIGRTEEILGRWLAGRRDKFVVATKCSLRTGSAAWDQGNSRRHVMDAIDASLRRLRTDHIDLYQLHAYDPYTPLDETLETLDCLVRAGKVRYIGCSNFLAYQVARALGRSEVRGLTRFASVQPRYNLLCRQAENELFPLCVEESLAVLPYNPLAGGLLTGKHDLDRVPTGGRFSLGDAGEIYKERYWHDYEFKVIDALAGLASEAGLSLPTLSVAWVMASPVVTAPILGASHPEQLDATLAAATMTLDPDLKSQLDRMTAVFRVSTAYA